MSDLNELLARVRRELKDPEGAIWTDEELTQHIRRALGAYTRVDPLRTVGELSTSANVREYSLADLAGLMEVLDVWYPYDPDSPTYPP
ncbi:MAG: hypothetical protein J7M05_00985, partial [Anaerolineae bacterium]|nr:hypothetical protein [Anaerolineae bacterium]